MRRLKELSLAEVNNCQKYFLKNKKGTNIWFINFKFIKKKYKNDNNFRRILKKIKNFWIIMKKQN